MMHRPTLRWLKRRRVAVLCGGWSGEKEISRRTGRAVLAAFRELGVRTAAVGADERLAARLHKGGFGFCFIALHGRWGEDGTVQGLCEMLRLPYAGSGVLASALGMDKVAAKRIFQSCGIPTPPFAVVSKREILPLRLAPPLVVKPVDSGSALGVSIVRRRSELAHALRLALRSSDRALVEKWIGGREVTAPVLGERVLPLIEIIPKSSFYDFKAKYVKGMSDHILPARLPEKTAKEVRRYALAAHRALGCRAFSRVDFIVDKRGRPWCLELNSIPGMTATSLFPEAAKAAGFSFPEMIVEIVRHSLSV